MCIIACCLIIPQVQRIYEYHKLLMRLYSLTPKEHPDYHDLRYTITNVGSVSPSGMAGVHDPFSGSSLYFPFPPFLQIVQAREHQLNQNQNEIKLEQVQIRFPHDNLYLSQPLDTMEVRMCQWYRADII